jgi:hypothetical protein
MSYAEDRRINAIPCAYVNDEVETRLPGQRPQD